MEVQRKYFQTLLERIIPNKTYCNVLAIYYKGIGIAELYIDDIDPSVINMSGAARKKWAFENYAFLVEDMRPEVLEDDEYFPPKVLTRKEILRESRMD